MLKVENWFLSPTIFIENFFTAKKPAPEKLRDIEELWPDFCTEAFLFAYCRFFLN